MLLPFIVFTSALCHHSVESAWYHNETSHIQCDTAAKVKRALIDIEFYDAAFKFANSKKILLSTAVKLRSPKVGRMSREFGMQLGYLVKQLIPLYLIWDESKHHPPNSSNVLLKDNNFVIFDEIFLNNYLDTMELLEAAYKLAADPRFGNNFAIHGYKFLLKLKEVKDLFDTMAV